MPSAVLSSVLCSLCFFKHFQFGLTIRPDLLLATYPLTFYLECMECVHAIGLAHRTPLLRELCVRAERIGGLEQGWGWTLSVQRPIDVYLRISGTSQNSVDTKDLQHSDPQSLTTCGGCRTATGYTQPGRWNPPVRVDADILVTSIVFFSRSQWIPVSGRLAPTKYTAAAIELGQLIDLGDGDRRN